LIAAFEALFGVLPGSRLERREGYVLLVCPPAPAIPQFNGVFAEEDGGALVAELPDAIAELDRHALPFWLQTRAERHPLVEVEAERLGLAQVDVVPGMVATATELTSATADELRIERAVEATDLVRALDVAAAGFEAPAEVLAALYGEAVSALPGLSIYLGFDGDEPISTAVGYVEGDAVGVFNVATPPAYRRRGFGAALTAHAARDGFAVGARFAWLQSSLAGESVYRRMGFRQVETYNVFTRAG
jgi:ribosomal protein S18 acetylase RimI-like enzyme